MLDRSIIRLMGLLIGVVCILFSATLAQAQAPGLPKVPPELEKLRQALMKYQDPVKAVRDGYFSTLGCIGYPFDGIYKHKDPRFRTGGMGIHFLNIKLIGPVPDPMKPPILLYEPEGDKLRLVGAEWFIPLATGIKERPVVFGQPFDGPMPGHEPLLPAELEHYDLHVWLFKENPAGLFHAINPDVKCPKTGYSFMEEPHKGAPQQH